ncbi:MAG TPA: M56 family metallopeptidase [Bacteroidales bacterium]|nr:M56 family metallopeptidase [Bacteroidales bacterium]
MNEFIVYIIQMVIASGILYLFYFIFLKNTTYFRLNRIYLLWSLILPPILPLIKIPVNEVLSVKTMPIVLDEIVITANGEVVQTSPITQYYSYMFYSLVAAFFVFRIIWAIVSVIRISKRSIKERYRNNVLVLSDEKINPFSIFKYIFLSRSHFEDKNGLEQILSHERVHIMQYHSIDNIISEIICSVFWINPFFWMIKNNLKSTHEYLADEKVMEQGFDTAGYFMLLFENVVGKRIGLANNFNESLTLKRMKMMKKNRSPRYLRLAYLLVLPLIAAVIFAFSCKDTGDLNFPVKNSNRSNISQEDTIKKAVVFGEVYEEVDEMPVYGNGFDDVAKYIISEVKYPEQAKKNGIQGKVFVSFVVTKTGKVENVEVVQSVNEFLDAEAVRVISSMGSWSPGKLDGKAVNVKMVMPIMFKLGDK